ncbi:MAG TPA: ATP-binding protein [Candidatus Saccharimonadales bacterium]|nr:ATP-binding protein [Candidatus Saccharimonadales bacterium]
MKLRQRLIILLLSIALVPAVLLGVASYITIGNELSNQTINQLTGIAEKQQQNVNSLLSEESQEIGGLLNRYEFDQGVQQALAGRTEKAAAPLTALLASRKTAYADISSMTVTDLKGMVLATTTSSAIGAQLPAEEYTLPAGQLSSVVVRTDPVDQLNKLYMVFGVSINNTRAATIVTTFTLSKLANIVEDYSGLGSTGETVVAQQDSQHKAVSLLALRFDPQGALHSDLSGLRLSGSDAAYQNLRDYRNHAVFAVTRGIAGAQWSLATKIDRAEALAPISVLRNIVIIIFGASLVVIIILALYFARSFLRPIDILTQRARLVTIGDFTQRIELNRRDEFGVLATTFNTMASRLAQSYQALEKKVADRTQELRKKLEELEIGKAKDDAILDSIGEGMIVTDAAARILMINELAANLLGVNRDAVLGSPAYLMYKLYDESDALLPDEQRPLQIALGSGQKVVQTVKSHRPDGSSLSLGLTASPVLQHKKIIGGIQIIRDITKEKQVDRMKTEFISLASHQLRTPLSAIKWFTEMLVSGDAGQLQPEQQEFARNIADSTERMIALVNALLNISRIESGRIMIDPKPTDLRELVSGIVNDLKGKTEERKQTLVISVHDGLPKINLDPRLIGQVYLNLLTNAIKYTPKGGEISVFISRKGEEIISQVTDNGYGIPKEQQGRLFQKFFRATNAVKVETDGTGLGLYLIKSVIESSGGKIWFESEEGKGSTFWFSIPVSGMKAKAGEVTLDA